MERILNIIIDGLHRKGLHQEALRYQRLLVDYKNKKYESRC